MDDHQSSAGIRPGDITNNATMTVKLRRLDSSSISSQARLYVNLRTVTR